MTDHVLDVRHLATWLPTSDGAVRAVDGVSLQVARGKALGIVGESGSGKSVLSRSILGLLPPRAILPSGEVWIDGREIRRLTGRRLRAVLGTQVAMVFQDPMTSLNPVIRVERQITEPLRTRHGMNRAAARRRALELLESVGIPEPARRLRAFPHELSGGMRQRVAIACALACRPSVLIADEPTTALDVTIQRQILDLLAELRRTEGMAVVLISHDLAVVAGRTDHVAVMYAGQIVEEGPTRTVFRAASHPYTTALLGAIPTLSNPPHSRLAVIPGRAPRVIDPPPGCRFAPRCPHAQPRCLHETPPLAVSREEGHAVACFFPVGTPAGARALDLNRLAGSTAAGRTVEPDVGAQV